jgi:hypothetical protein
VQSLFRDIVSVSLARFFLLPASKKIHAIKLSRCDRRDNAIMKKLNRNACRDSMIYLNNRCKPEDDSMLQLDR